MLDNSVVTQRLIPAMLDAAQAAANEEASSIIHQRLKTMQARLDLEINRLRLLQQINGNVRENEIMLALNHKEGLEEAIQNARTRLDALRLIWKGAGSDE